jgi:hypothetical protein
MYAVMKDDEALVDFLLQRKKIKRDKIRRAQDLKGKTAVHYVVNPIAFGSYENVKILRKLHQFGFAMNVRDETGLTPLQYAEQ